MTVDITPENVARVCTALRDWEQCDEGVNNDAREDAADMLEALSDRLAEVEVARDMMGELWAKEGAARQVAEERAEAAEAEVAKLRGALEFYADKVAGEFGPAYISKSAQVRKDRGAIALAALQEKPHE